MRIVYRLRQFWRAIFVKINPLDLQRALALMNPAQAELFLQLQPSEQQHALGMVRRLIEQGDDQADLLVAALLHDAGKLRYRMNPLERTAVVLVGVISPTRLKAWGSLPPAGWESLPGWRRAFVVAEQHARWGAEMARQAGVSPLAETLIREHHHPHLEQADAEANRLLKKLWAVDNAS